MIGDESAVSRFFKGERGIDLDMIEALAQFFGMSVPELLGGPAPSPHGRDDLFQDLAVILKSKDQGLLQACEFVIIRAAAEARTMEMVDRKAGPPKRSHDRPAGKRSA